MVSAIFRINGLINSLENLNKEEVFNKSKHRTKSSLLSWRDGLRIMGKWVHIEI